MATKKKKGNTRIKCEVDGCDQYMTWDSNDQCYKCPNGHVRVYVFPVNAGKSRYNRNRILFKKAISRRKKNIIELTDTNKKILFEKFTINRGVNYRNINKLYKIKHIKSKSSRKVRGYER